MPNKNEKNKSNTDRVKALQDAIFASNYGISKDFVDKNSEIIQKSSKSVNDVLLGYGVNNVNSGSNSLVELASLVSHSIRFKENKNAYRNNVNSSTSEDIDSTGIRTITPLGNIDSDERTIISEVSKDYQSFLNVTSEYRGICKIVPEIDRAIQNIVRDILSVSELSGRAISKVYSNDVDIGSSSSEANKIVKTCNDLILEEIVDKNDLERKFKRWVYESVVCGAKPVAFIPYDYIVRQLKQLNSKDSELKLNISDVENSIKSGESFSICENKSQYDKFVECSVESCIEDMIDVNKLNGGSVDIASDKEFDKLLDDDICEQFAIFCENDADLNISNIPVMIEKVNDDNIRYRQINNVESSESIAQLDLLESMKNNYSKKKEEASKLSKDDRITVARKGLRQLARFIDENIDVVKSGASSAYIANKIMNQKDRYNKFYDLGKNYYMAEGIKSDKKSKQNKNISDDNSMQFDNSTVLGKEWLIVPYSPESVVPININGEYMGFYAMEYEHATGVSSKHRRRSGSFSDYVLQQGFGSDSNFLGGNAPMVAYGGSDPLENNLYSPLALYNYSVNQYMNGSMDQQDRKFDIMKNVVLRVLSHRLRDADLVENKSFKDAVMHMLRNDFLIRKKVQFTFIPPEFMCYMTYKTDDSGIPVSILDGTLFWAYMYISSVVSSAMIKMLKSSDKEKYEVDVGLQKNAGYTIDELQRVLSTRSLYTGSMFSNLSSVIKNAGSYQRLIIPVFNDKKLYDVQQIERQNDISPDDDFTGKLLSSILSKIYVNAGMASEMDSVDFAKQLSMRNLEYRNNIIDAQHNYEPFITKAIKILTYYSNLMTKNSKAEAKDNKSDLDNKFSIDVSKIKVELSIPTMLSMSNITEVVDAAKQVANSITEVYNLQDGNNMETMRNALFKKRIIQKYANIVEWETIEQLLDDATREAAKEVSKMNKLSKIDENIQNLDSESDDDTVYGEDAGGGGDDMDMGMDEGGDEASMEE